MTEKGGCVWEKKTVSKWFSLNITKVYSGYTDKNIGHQHHNSFSGSPCCQLPMYKPQQTLFLIWLFGLIGGVNHQRMWVKTDLIQNGQVPKLK